jgi:NADPH:quinone reductase-like Zn-dependent oxidoreductase
MTYNVRDADVGVSDQVESGTMKAMVQNKYGSANDVLRMHEVPLPGIGGDEVLVQVHSSSVNAMEWYLMNGKPYLFRAAFGLRPKRKTLGADISGTVVSVGENVSRFERGDEVFGEIGAGAYAEFAKAAESHLVAKPENVNFEQAAAVGVAGLTALQGLRDVLRVDTGQKMLINGASGGVGTYAIQIAKVLGAEVTAVCSTRNVDQARELGADRVVDYQAGDITQSAERFPLIFDIAGNHKVRDCIRLLEPGGTYVMVGAQGGPWTGPLMRMVRAKLVFAFIDRKAKTFVAESRADDLAELAAFLASRKVNSVIEDTFPLPEVGIALDRQGWFHARGKTVIRVEGTV